MSTSSIQLLVSLCSENNENSVWDKTWVLDLVLKWTFWVIVLHLSFFRDTALCSAPWKAKVLPLEVLFLSFWKKAFLEMMPERWCVPCAHHLQEHNRISSCYARVHWSSLWAFCFQLTSSNHVSGNFFIQQLISGWLIWKNSIKNDSADSEDRLVERLSSVAKKIIYLRNSLMQMLWSHAFIFGRMSDFSAQDLLFAVILNILMQSLLEV